MDVIRSESERSRFLADYLSVLKEFFQFSLQHLFFLGLFYKQKKIKFLKNFEPVIFEDFFIKNWESFKKWKTKGFYTIFTTNEHE